MQKAETVLGIIEQKAQCLDYTFPRLYRNLYNPDFYLKAAAKRNLTVTADEIEAAVAALRCHREPQSQKMALLLKDVLSELLAAVYQPILKNKNNLGTALYRLKTGFRDVHWIIKGNLEECLADLSLEALKAVLQKRIDDNRFIELIWRQIRDNIKSQLGKTAVEIYLHQLDIWLESQADCCLRLGEEFVIGLESISRTGAEQFLEQLEDFLESKLYLPAAAQHISLIDWTDSEHFYFYGYQISLDEQNIKIKIPTQVIYDQLKPFTSRGKGVHRGYLIHLDPAEIVRIYARELRTLYQRYCYADNIAYQMRKFHYYHRSSLIKTLAAKLKLSCAQVVKRYSLDGTIGVTANGQAVKYCDFSFARKRLTGEPYAGKPARTVRRGKLK